jgi:hypothetical protein
MRDGEPENNRECEMASHEKRPTNRRQTTLETCCIQFWLLIAQSQNLHVIFP